MRADNSIEEYFLSIKTFLTSAKNDTDLFQMVVDVPFHDKLHTTTLDLGIVVLLLVDKKEQTINRIAYSRTEPANHAISTFTKPFQEIKIPLENIDNISAKAIRMGKPLKTTDWYYLFTPELSPQSARFYQAESGMDCSFIYPLVGVRDGGALIFSFYQPISHIRAKHRTFMKRYTGLVTEVLKT